MADRKQKIHTDFLDEDLDENFITDEAAEAFLNEVGDIRACERKNGEPAVKVNVQDQAGAAAGVNADTEKNEKSAGLPPEEKKAKKGRKAVLIIAAALTLTLLAVGGTYVALGSKYTNVFFPNTQINGIDASGKSVEEVKAAIASGIDDYVLSIEARGQKTEKIEKADIELRAEFDGSLEELLEKQEPLQWLKYRLNPSSHQIKTMIVYNQGLLDKKIDGLDFMNPSMMIPCRDAHLSDYTAEEGYVIVPEVSGNTVDPDAVRTAIKASVASLAPELSLEEAGVYKAPAIDSEDPTLTALCHELNRLTATTVTYRFGDKVETLGGERIREWLVVNSDNTVSINQEPVAAYVEELSMAYDTYNKAKTLKTSYGSTIQIRGGNYGWRINKAAETEALMEVIKAGVSTEREPVYSQKAASRGGNDYGDTYVEMNLTAQHLFFYKNGKLVVESDFVSGNLSKGWTTPPGTFPLTYKQRNATLKGEGYRTPVDYWMPFNGGIGMHDAKWRSSFGGSIYKTGGSHGCINLPHNVAKKIYEDIASGMPVLCYNLPGTESGGSEQKPPAPTPAPEIPAPEIPAPEAPAPDPEVPAPAPLPQPSPAPESLPVLPAEPSPEDPVETTAPAGPAFDSATAGAQGPGA